MLSVSCSLLHGLHLCLACSSDRFISRSRAKVRSVCVSAYAASFSVGNCCRSVRDLAQRGLRYFEIPRCYPRIKELSTHFCGKKQELVIGLTEVQNLGMDEIRVTQFQDMSHKRRNLTTALQTYVSKTNTVSNKVNTPCTHTTTTDVFLKCVLSVCAFHENPGGCHERPRRAEETATAACSAASQQQTDAMALAAALHHSAGPKVEMQQHAHGLNTGTGRGRGGVRAGRHPAGTDDTSSRGAGGPPAGGRAAEE